MSFLQRATLFLSVLSSLVYVDAAPTPQNVVLAQKYAPQFRFHKDEIYFASTVDFFLSGPVSLNDDNGPLAGAPSPLTNENLATVANQGSGTHITTNINANLNGFLRGQNPRNSQPMTYVFVSPKANGVVDLYYWIFTPYNLGKKVLFLGYVGNHVGDWERITVRTVNGVATSVDYRAHGDTGSGTIPWAQVPKFSPSSPNAPASPTSSDANARPIAYVAKGSHGTWSSAGTFTYVDAVVFKLQDVTSDGGAYWDTQNSLTVINYPETYGGSLNWLNYKGNWGNKEVNNCWWYAIHDECELVGGPSGPLRTEMSNLKRRKRDMTRTLLENLRADDLPTHTLATVSTDGSTYAFYTDASNADLIAVEQVCASVNATASADSAEPIYSYSTSLTYTAAKAGTSRYTVTVSPCGSSSFVASYSIGSCVQESQCSLGDRRPIRAYSEDPAVQGPQEVAAVTVHDLDIWFL